MGTVYEAQDSALKRQVAVKVARDDLLGSADAINRFEQEALAAAAFAHPHVVTVHDYGTVGALAFLVMERLHGLRSRSSPPGATVTGTAELPCSVTPTVAARCVRPLATSSSFGGAAPCS